MDLFFFLFSGSTVNSQDSVRHQAFTGKIDRHPITLHLQESGGEYSGFYYYHSSKTPIELKETKGYENLRLSAFSRWDRTTGAAEEEFVLSVKGDSLNGTWQPGDGSRKLAVKLSRLPAPPFVFQVNG